MTNRRWWVLAPVLGVAACGGATFKIVQTPWQGDESMARLARGATSAGCRVSEPDSTGEIEIRCPSGVPEPGRDEGSIRVGPDSEGVLLALCNDGLAEGCGGVLEKFWKAAER